MDSKQVKKDVDKLTDSFFQYVVDKTSSITRYNTRKFIKRQSVLEHEGAVATIAMVLSDHFNKIGIKNNGEEVIRMALLHDLDELLSGDVPHDAKYQSGAEGDKLREALNLLSEKTISNALGMIGDDQLAKNYKKLLDKERRKDSIEARIVKLADFIDVIIYANTEISMGNATLNKELSNARMRADEMIEQICKS